MSETVSQFYGLKSWSNNQRRNEKLHYPRQIGYTGPPIDPIISSVYPHFLTILSGGTRKVRVIGGYINAIGFAPASVDDSGVITIPTATASTKIWVRYNTGTWSFGSGADWPVTQWHVKLADVSTTGSMVISLLWGGGDLEPATVFPVTLSASTGGAGSYSTDCVFTYTVSNTNGIDIFGATTLPVNVRTAKCQYAPATKGLAWVTSAGGFEFYALDETPIGKVIDAVIDLRLSGVNIQIGTVKATVLDSGGSTTWTTKITGEACPSSGSGV